MGLARAQPALGPGPGDRAGWGRPGVHEESGPACRRTGDRAGHPPGGAATLPGTVAGAKQLGRGGTRQGGAGSGDPSELEKSGYSPSLSSCPPPPHPHPNTFFPPLKRSQGSLGLKRNRNIHRGLVNGADRGHRSWRLFFGGVSSVHGVTLRPLLVAPALGWRADHLPSRGAGLGGRCGPVASLATTPDGCAPPALPRRPQELLASGASFPRRPPPRRVAEGSAPREGTAEQGKSQPPADGPCASPRRYFVGFFFFFSTDLPVLLAPSLSCSLAPSLAGCLF